MDQQHFTEIVSFLEDRLRPLFDPENGSDHGFGMDDTSRALRALRGTISGAGAVNGICEQRATADVELRRVIDQTLALNWDQLVGLARHWEDHPDFRPAFKRGSWDFDAEPSAATGGSGAPQG
ncbi:hypothetical protein [Streptomyces sp. NPDC003023]|uniref:hypothetical protein n=1 Tax=Streptomyces sp. NPDC003023 TaxID=3364675 RepID=UPI0036777F36